jgi:hypothetical protein
MANKKFDRMLRSILANANKINKTNVRKICDQLNTVKDDSNKPFAIFF